MKGLYRLHKTI